MIIENMHPPRQIFRPGQYSFDRSILRIIKSRTKILYEIKHLDILLSHLPHPCTLLAACVQLRPEPVQATSSPLEAS